VRILKRRSDPRLDLRVRNLFRVCARRDCDGPSSSTASSCQLAAASKPPQGVDAVGGRLAGSDTRVLAALAARSPRVRRVPQPSQTGNTDGRPSTRRGRKPTARRSPTIGASWAWRAAMSPATCRRDHGRDCRTRRHARPFGWLLVLSFVVAMCTCCFLGAVVGMDNIIRLCATCPFNAVLCSRPHACVSKQNHPTSQQHVYILVCLPCCVSCSDCLRRRRLRLSR
jgi:hypothetical protein